jgi:hypothetical protein
VKVSRHFLCALAGVAMTLLAWYGPWEWPAAPALVVMERGFGAAFAELEYRERAAAIVLLIAVNVGTWAIVANLVALAMRRRAHS